MTTDVLHNPRTGETCRVLDIDAARLVLEIELTPAAAGAPLHYHRVISETFTVLSGELSVEWDARNNWRTLAPGDSIHVLPLQRHGFANRSGRPVTFRLEVAPPQGFLRFLGTMYRNPGALDAIRALSYGDVWLPGIPVGLQKTVHRVLGA
ncbi:MAG: cupin domain-containing protein [Bryobacteraceae bacterium]|nr:cupin domain-containing protein [Bryobacteraceae bacterium]